MKNKNFEYEKGQRLFEGELFQKNWKDLSELEQAKWAAREEANPLFRIADTLEKMLHLYETRSHR